MDTYVVTTGSQFNGVSAALIVSRGERIGAKSRKTSGYVAAGLAEHLLPWTCTMTLSALVLMGIVSAAAWWSRRYWLARSLAAVVVALFLAIGCGPLTNLLLGGLQDAYVMGPPIRWAQRNAIVILAAGTTRLDEDAPLAPSLFGNGRLLQAATLYHRCHAAGQQCTVLVSGGDSQDHGTAESTIYAATLVGAGLPAADVQTETRSHNTYENARYSRPLLSILEPQRLVLVTSGIHLRRSLLAFDHFGMRPLPVAGDVLKASLSLCPLASNIGLFDAALHEYLGILQFHLYNLLGKNTPTVVGRVIP